VPAVITLERSGIVSIQIIMKHSTLTLSLAVASLTIIAITSQAQDTGTYTHSSANGQGGMDTLTVTKPLPAPPGPLVAMYNRPLDSANPFIAVNDPAKVGQAAPKGPAWNHNGRVYAEYVRSESLDSYDYTYAYAQPDCTEYRANLNSGKWHAFVNGE
jgi:hypothetical protein